MEKRYIFNFLAVAPDRSQSDYTEFYGIPQTFDKLIKILKCWIKDGYTIHHLTIKSV